MEIEFTHHELEHFKPRVLVTGGNGFIGTPLTKALINEGWEVAIFDKTHYQKFDVRSREACHNIFDNFRPDTVIHLAGILGTDELFDAPYDAIDVNVTGALNILNMCVEFGTDYVGITMLPVFPSIYTATKVAAQMLATAYHHTHGIGVCHVRAFNGFGPGQAHGSGHPRKIIPAFATEGWANEPLTIWGDGNQTVDLIHTDQLADVFVQSINLFHDELVEAGTGYALTVNEVADFVIEVTGSTAGVQHMPMRRGEVSTNVVSTQLGWEHLERQPIFSWKQLKETIESYKP